MTQSLADYLAAVNTRFNESDQSLPDIKPEQLHPSYIAYAEFDGWSLILHYIGSVEHVPEAIALCLVPTSLEPTDFHSPPYKYQFHEPDHLEAAMAAWRAESERIRQEGL